ncbi:hypothetical protein B0J13DRAFT_514475 [Dactylonectria estremocensis]|uniref:Zn(2)-C6 fungal-type domain-containing protein n=1 Tax=Dactylonectria estremocensis TaxID=1079267 RepID=A0A9P9IE48_9HYPO|nr:hypothetical protein B0J13DRAFT_514475 [Dactylonectria estremocensis]
MVNRGQPSRDCHPCRKRKLRCDLLVEGCGQCRRAGLKCHGYRDRQSLLFRDETRSTQQKALARQAATHSSAPQGMEFGWDVRARFVFLSTYVLGFSHSLGSVAPLCNKASTAGHLSASLEAISLAFMANQLHAPDLMQLANASYFNAIQKLGQALEGLSASGAEETLQSVLLLDQYEKIVHRNPHSSSSWMSHAHGGLSLIGAYARELHLSPTGCQLGVRLITSLTVSSAAMAIRVPAAVKDLRSYLDPYMCGVKWDFLGILVQVVDLQADVHNVEDDYLGNLAERAEQLDKLLLNLQLKMPSSWRPRQISPAKPHPLIFGTHYEIFANHFMTQVNNGIRVARLIVNNIIMEYTPFDMYESSSCSRILAAVMDLTQQICATVPQFLLPDTNSAHTIPFSSLQSLQCCALLAPLYITYRTSNDILMRDWISQCLAYMAETGRMKVAQDVAELVKKDQNLDYWLVYAMIGSYGLAA